MPHRRLIDGEGRAIRYLRVSVTDRCNLRCRYCMPPEGVASLPHDRIVTYEEIERVVRILAPRGVRSVRITGGEPLVRRGLPGLVRTLSRLDGVEDLALTTNGLLLGRMAGKLAEAGLARVNVSLDTLRPDRFLWITRLGEGAGGGAPARDGNAGAATIDTVLKGIEGARRAGLSPVKINVVVVRDFNDDEIVDFARLAEKHPYEIRFIEFMPMGDAGFWKAGNVVTAEEMKDRLTGAFSILVPERNGRGAGPARSYRAAGFAGTLGFITPLSSHFCEECNRLRLTADGRIRTCLFSDAETDLMPLLRGGGSDEEILAAVLAAVEKKPRRHGRTLEGNPLFCRRTMPLIGG